MANTRKQHSASTERQPQINTFQRLIALPIFARLYLIGSLVILFGSTLFWSILGSRLQQGNADQLANAYLFQNSHVLKGALFPAQHSFLLKWPLFLLIKAFGYTNNAFVAVTVLTVLVTVALLALLLFRIERRPIIFGTLCLGLASVLLLVPAQSYPGALLPVNMAMLTTRNLEYVIFIACLALLVKSPRLKSISFWISTTILALLVASDKLFLILALVGALSALIVYSLVRSWNFVSLSVHWLVNALVGGLGGFILLWFINVTAITHISSGGSEPYNLIHSLHGLFLGIFYAVFGLFTNFGANPAYAATTLRDIPHQFWAHLFSVSFLAFAVNGVIALSIIYVVWELLFSSLFHNRYRGLTLNTPYKLSITLIWASVASMIAFSLTDHAYAVDARYLTIAVFTGFVALAVHTSNRKWRSEHFVIAGIIILLGIVGGFMTASRTNSKSRAALATINDRDHLVTQALAQHPTSTLVGDYWRVLPTKQVSGGDLNVTPLADCTSNREDLSSSAWQPDISTNSFSYLLPLDRSMTDFPTCSLNEVVSHYGRPNSSTLIAGSLDKPSEVLLHYDHGVNNSAPKSPQPPQGPSTVVPVSLEELPNTSCSAATIMNVVAHQDDDLLFMNPDLTNDLQSDHCIRTVYVTAGDAGSISNFGWLSREKGSEAAYAKMLGITDIWVERIVKISDHEFVTIANPRGNSRVSLIFMHLPDGNLKGEGFPATHHQSLAALEAGSIPVLNTIDSQSMYSSAQLYQALSSIMAIYKPAEIRTQADYVGHQYPDHSDHITVGHITQKAYRLYENEQYENKVVIPLTFYIGYPVHEMPENVFGKALAQKQAAFLAYARFDGGVCNTILQCSNTPTYGSYLKRQYKQIK